MKKNYFLWALIACIITGCGGKTSQHDEHDHDHDHEHEEHSEDHDHDHDAEHQHIGSIHEHHHRDMDKSAYVDEVVFPCYKAESDSLEYEIIEKSSFRQVIKCSGQVLAAQGEEAAAVASVSGVVSFRGKITEGVSVSRGSALVTVSSRNMVDGDPVQKAQVAYETAKKEYERMKSLVDSKIVSQKEYNQAQQNYETARIAYQAVSKNQSGGGQVVSAPIAGYVKSVYVREGDYVEVGQPLVSITQNRRLSLRAEVPEKYYQYLHTIGSANFKTPYDNRVYSLSELNGRLLSFGKTSAENSFYVPVTFEFDNVGEIIPGSFVEIYLLSTPMEGVLALPRTALVEEQGHYFVYIHLDAEGYKKQEVKIGADDGVSVQILSGVQEGDCVVKDGAYQIKLGTSTSAIPAHSHEH